jgi:hypothetical protein
MRRTPSLSSGLRRLALVSAAFVASVAAAAAADLPSRAPPPPPSPPQDDKEHWLLVAGVNVERHSLVGYFAGIHSVRSGLFESGWRLRLGGAMGRYTYAPVLGGRTGVDFQQFDPLLGRHFKTGRGGLTIYVGPEWQKHDNPDPFARVRGTAWGAKLLVDYYQPIGERMHVFAFGSYSTAFKTYLGVAQFGFRLNERFTLGPEASASGNLSHDKIRFGGFLDYRFGRAHAINLSAGWSEMLRNGPGNQGSSPYAQAQVTLRF